MIIHRPATPADRAFICDSWISSYRTSYAAGLIPMSAWHGIMWPIVEGYLDRPNVRTLVAVAKRDPSFLFGFLAADTTEQREPDGRTWPALVHYVFVKAAYRRTGLARGLFEAMGIEPRGRWAYASKTAVIAKLAHKIPLAKWNPLLARFDTQERAA